MITQDFTDVLRVEGVNAKGYGIIPKLAMQDNRLTLEAKGIYSYFCSYAGAGTTAFPSVPLILKHLGISETRYYKHFKQLKKYGYISTKQLKTDGKFSKTIYTLCPNPIISMDSPSISFKGTAISPSISFECTENECTENECTQNKGSNINSIEKLTVFKKHQSINQKKGDGLIEEYSFDFLKEKLSVDAYKENYDLYESLAGLVYDVLNHTGDSIKVNGSSTPISAVKGRFTKLNEGHLQYVCEMFSLQSAKINNPRQYLITALYNSYTSMDGHYKNAVNYERSGEN